MRAGAKPKHLLVYGANGSGKTSIQDALWYAFYRTKSEYLERTDPLLPPEEKARIVNDRRELFRNKQDSQPFAIKIDGRDIFTDTFDEYNSFIIRRSDLNVSDTISIKGLILRCRFPETDIDSFLQALSQSIIEDVNTNLRNLFYETVEICSVDASQGWKCTIRDLEHNVEQADSLPSVVNEANLNLISLLVLTKYVMLNHDQSKKNLIILDDFVTSLDSANRLAVTKYLLDYFSEKFQIVLLTHNVSYYNLVLHIINNGPFTSKDDWEVVNLIKSGSKHAFYRSNDIRTARSIDKYYETHNATSDILNVGNMIRQSFEASLHDFVSLMLLGGVEDTKSILERLTQYDTIYFKNSSDLQKLISVIDTYVDEAISCPVKSYNKIKEIERCIMDYKHRGIADIISVIRELRLYQKIVMHPMSHGQTGETQWSDSEIKHSLELLKRLELAMNSIRNGLF